LAAAEVTHTVTSTLAQGALSANANTNSTSSAFFTIQTLATSVTNAAVAASVAGTTSAAAVAKNSTSIGSAAIKTVTVTAAYTRKAHKTYTKKSKTAVVATATVTQTQTAISNHTLTLFHTATITHTAFNNVTLTATHKKTYNRTSTVIRTATYNRTLTSTHKATSTPVSLSSQKATSTPESTPASTWPSAPESTPTSESTKSTSDSSWTAPESHSSNAQNVYHKYTGDGSVTAGWPTVDEWVDFDTMWKSNMPNMQASCSQWGVADNTEEEIADLKDAIHATAEKTGVDERFLFAIIMQESTGCVRVITTHFSMDNNKGLMQSHGGTASCNTNSANLASPGVIGGGGKVKFPCPAEDIRQMIEDGVMGTASGEGLAQIMKKQGHHDHSRWYRAARIYSGGSIGPKGGLDHESSYASDIANRLTGWVNAPNTPEKKEERRK
jgi:hypothetical protein